MNNEIRRLVTVLLLLMVVLTASLRTAEAAVGDFVRKWGAPQHYYFPSGICVDKGGNVYVTDLQRVQLFTADGKLIRKWGSYGSGNGQLAYPAGITVSAAGEVFVADGNNYRIEVFDTYGNFLRKWGSNGSAPGQFLDHPQGIALDSSGNVYVSERSGTYDPVTRDFFGRIQVFDRNGNFLRFFGSVGTADTQITNPMSIAIDGSGNIYVGDHSYSDYVGQVRVFNSAGGFQRSFNVAST